MKRFLTSKCRIDDDEEDDGGDARGSSTRTEGDLAILVAQRPGSNAGRLYRKRSWVGIVSAFVLTSTVFRMLCWREERDPSRDRRIRCIRTSRKFETTCLKEPLKCFYLGLTKPRRCVPTTLLWLESGTDGDVSNIADCRSGPHCIT